MGMMDTFAKAKMISEALAEEKRQEEAERERAKREQIADVDPRLDTRAIIARAARSHIHQVEFTADLNGVKVRATATRAKNKVTVSNVRDLKTGKPISVPPDSTDMFCLRIDGERELHLANVLRDAPRPKVGDIIYPDLDPYWEVNNTGWSSIRFQRNDDGTFMTRIVLTPFRQVDPRYAKEFPDNSLAGKWTWIDDRHGLVCIVKPDPRIVRDDSKRLWTHALETSKLGLKVTKVRKRSVLADVVEVTNDLSEISSSVS